MHHAGSHDIQIPVVSWLWEGEILYIHWFSTRCYHMRWWYKRKKWWWHVYSQIWLELHWWVDSPGVLLSTHDPELWDSYYQTLLKTIRLVVKILFWWYLSIIKSSFVLIVIQGSTHVCFCWKIIKNTWSIRFWYCSWNMKIKLMHCLLQTSRIFDNAFTDMDQHSLAYFAIKLVVYVKIIFQSPIIPAEKQETKAVGCCPQALRSEFQLSS